MPLWRAPCPGGYRPVMIVACEVSVMGAELKAESNRAPRAASASMAGVRADR